MEESLEGLGQIWDWKGILLVIDRFGNGKKGAGKEEKDGATKGGIKRKGSGRDMRGFFCSIMYTDEERGNEGRKTCRSTRTDEGSARAKVSKNGMNEKRSSANSLLQYTHFILPFK